MNTDIISLVGLGKLGLCLATVYAQGGKKVIGIDVLPDVVDNINNGISSLVEPGLSEAIAEVGGNKLLATLDHKRAIKESDITIILTATPSLPDGSFSNAHVINALTALAEELCKSEKSYHLFVISSTVIPGSIENSFIPLIEKHSNRKLNEGFGICYDPDFVALGSVIKDFRNPDFILIGESNSRDGKLLEELHLGICDNSPPVKHMSLVSAEIAKVSLNAFVTLKISFANIIGNICDKINNANPDDVTQAIGIDKRISPHYFKAGLSFGGTCFPRDTWALNAILDQFEIPLELMRACHKANDYQDTVLADKVIRLCERLVVKKVGILGLAFKSDTPVITESPAIKLIKALLDDGIDVIAYDPLAAENTKEIFGDALQYAGNVHECLDGAKLSVLTIPSKEIAQHIYTYIRSSVEILDCWRILDDSRLPDCIKRHA
jgi:UDPglucose 6-dehydrogenase